MAEENGEKTSADDELARRRQERTEGEDPEGGKSIEDLADGDEDAPEMFPLGTLSGDPKRTVKNLIRAGAKVTTAVSMTRAAVPNPTGGLFDPEEEVSVLVRVLPGPVTQSPTHTSEAGLHKVKEWKISQELRVIHVAHAGSMYSEEQVVELMEAAGIAGPRIAELLGAESAAAV